MSRSDESRPTPRHRMVCVVIEFPANNIVRGICRFARSAGWHSVITLPIVPDYVQGVIAYSSTRIDWLVPKMRALGIPLVDLGVLFDDPLVTHVQTDHAKICETGAQYFLDRGFRHVMLAARGMVAPVYQTTFRRVMRAAGLRAHLLPEPAGSVTPDEWYGRHLLRLPKPLGIIANTDAFATEMIQVCQDVCLDIPRQVAILGIGDDEGDREMAPVPLSYVRQNAERCGFEAAVLLDRMMHGDPPPLRHPC